MHMIGNVNVTNQIRIYYKGRCVVINSNVIAKIKLISFKQIQFNMWILRNIISQAMIALWWEINNSENERKGTLFQ